MEGYTVNIRGWSLGLWPSDLVWIVVNLERLGDREIPHGLGGEIRWHPCLFWPSDLVEIMVKVFITCLLFGLVIRDGLR